MSSPSGNPGRRSPSPPVPPSASRQKTTRFEPSSDDEDVLLPSICSNQDHMRLEEERYIAKIRHNPTKLAKFRAICFCRHSIFAEKSPSPPQQQQSNTASRHTPVCTDGSGSPKPRNEYNQSLDTDELEWSLSSKSAAVLAPSQAASATKNQTDEGSSRAKSPVRELDYAGGSGVSEQGRQRSRAKSQSSQLAGILHEKGALTPGTRNAIKVFQEENAEGQWFDAAEEELLCGLLENPESALRYMNDFCSVEDAMEWLEILLLAHNSREDGLPRLTASPEL